MSISVWDSGSSSVPACAVGSEWEQVKQGDVYLDGEELLEMSDGGEGRTADKLLRDLGQLVRILALQ